MGDGGGEVSGQYGEAVCSAVPVAAGVSEQLGHGFPRGAGAAGSEAVELRGGAEFGEGPVQGVVVEFGTDQEGGSASQHLWIRGRGSGGMDGGGGFGCVVGCGPVGLLAQFPAPLKSRAWCF
ncbi:hypothetical protein SCAB_71122 [Streptomyces scabiei 87.22]|uniref:Uncharacterized protein n=1 Tax=Streptomyces scabiei (strain 87.22) TaxID=680198 RepID=C9YZT5_STRSW|nr:hypothetical protein SCAB_71122 [Streptomyces scabiei 87.22]